MVQILDNIIVNAVQAYAGKGGEIILQIDRIRDKFLYPFGIAGRGSTRRSVAACLRNDHHEREERYRPGPVHVYRYSKGMFQGGTWFTSQGEEPLSILDCQARSPPEGSISIHAQEPRDPLIKKKEFKIMLVDDEEGIIDSVKAMLNRNGYCCVGYTDPMEAQGYWRRNPSICWCWISLCSRCCRTRWLSRFSKTNKGSISCC